MIDTNEFPCSSHEGRDPLEAMKINGGGSRGMNLKEILGLKVNYSIERDSISEAKITFSCEKFTKNKTADGTNILKSIANTG